MFPLLGFRPFLLRKKLSEQSSSLKPPQEVGAMTQPRSSLNRRDFLKASAGGGFALGSFLGLGIDLQEARAEVGRLKIEGGREVPSICPYCAVGCGQLVSVRQGRIVNIEGNPESPINQGTLCPKGAATYQLAVNDNRITKVWYRAPGATEWDKTKTLDWAMNRIAQLVKQTRDETFVETRTLQELGLNTSPTDEAGMVGLIGLPGVGPIQSVAALQARKKVNHTLAIASLGGATMDNEWNYLQCKLMRALGVVFLENQARI
jgi:formate dehydrogenase major subunit